MEDVTHIKSRVELFPCTGEIVRVPGGIPQCRRCMARWIRDKAAQHDANVGLVAPPMEGAPGSVDGLEAFLDRAHVPVQLRAGLVREIYDLGAVSIRELVREDWEGLTAWARLREMERRRIITALG